MRSGDTDAAIIVSDPSPITYPLPANDDAIRSIARRLYDAVRDRKIFVPAQHSVILTGFPTGEALIRSFYGARRLSRARAGVRSA